MAKALCSEEVGYLPERLVDSELLKIDIAGAKTAAEPISKTASDMKRTIKALKYSNKKVGANVSTK